MMADYNAPHIEYRFIELLITLLDAPAGAGIRQSPQLYLVDDFMPDDKCQEILAAYLGVRIKIERLIEFAEAFSAVGQFPQITYWLQPSGLTTRGDRRVGVVGMQRADFISLLIQLERLGLPVDAAPWVAELLPAVRDKKYLTTGEYCITTYLSQRNQYRLLRRSTRPESVEPYSRGWETGETAIGLIADTDDQVVKFDLIRHKELRPSV